MITTKLIAYSPEEVRILHAILQEDWFDLLKDCNDTDLSCSACSVKTLCDDLERVIDYLGEEIVNDYPHTYHKKGE